MNKLLQRLTVPYIEDTVPVSLSQFDSLQKHPLLYAPWPEFPYKPNVHFYIAHDNRRIFLKFLIEEKELRTEVKAINGAIWEDSCAEFFISFDNGASYYNFEFNSEGYGLVGYGTNRNNRNLLPVSVIEKIQAYPVVNKQEARICWQLLLIIPTEVFIYSPGLELANKEYTGNFYKCGDKLSDPHFLAWSPVHSPKPDFHLTGCFGIIKFE